MIPAQTSCAPAKTGSLVPPAANVTFLMHGSSEPWFDMGNLALATANGYAATLDTSIKPWGAGSFYTGNAGTHAKGSRVIETGTTFALGTAFCVESMVYCGAAGARIFDTRTNTSDTAAWTFLVNGSMQVVLTIGSTSYGTTSPSATVSVNTWTHVRANYDGTTVRIFIAGALVWSGAASLNVTTSGSPLCIGNNNGNNVGIADQYLAEMRVCKGVSLNTTAFTPPSAPWPDIGPAIAQQTNVTYSNVVLRSTYDSNVADVSNAAHTMTANGSAASSSGTSKFGGGSLLLDGTGDYVSTPDSADFDFSTGDYQLQLWAYRNGSKGGNSTLLGCYAGSSSGYSLSMDVSTNVFYWNETGDGVDGAFGNVNYALANQTWTHVAVTRKNGWIYTFVSGALQRFAASSQTVNCAANLNVGRLDNGNPGNDWLGSIDDIQLVKGQALLSISFLVPTAALPTS